MSEPASKNLLSIDFMKSISGVALMPISADMAMGQLDCSEGTKGGVQS